MSGRGILFFKTFDKIPQHNLASARRRRWGSFFILDDKEANNQGCVSYVRNNTSNVLNPLDEPFRLKKPTLLHPANLS
jgi:hypothetical protein